MAANDTTDEIAFRLSKLLNTVAASGNKNRIHPKHRKLISDLYVDRAEPKLLFSEKKTGDMKAYTTAYGYYRNETKVARMPDW